MNECEDTLEDQKKRTESEELKSGRIRALLMDNVAVVAAGDYGADHAALSEDHLAKLAEANIFVLGCTWQ
eukprot:IDg725t1